MVSDEHLISHNSAMTPQHKGDEKMKTEYIPFYENLGRKISHGGSIRHNLRPGRGPSSLFVCPQTFVLFHKKERLVAGYLFSIAITIPLPTHCTGGGQMKRNSCNIYASRD